ncbi:MAG: hypothetical protein AB7O59_11935 [Pirellulales bacterium]
MSNSRRHLLCLLSLVVGLSAASAARASSIEPESILDAIIWIEHHSGLVHSARGDFTVHYLPTSQEDMRRINALCRYRGHEYRAAGYFISQRQANRRSYYAAWWRAGVKERQEKTHIARPAIVETTVFDGSVVKTLDGTPGRSCLYLTSPEANWMHKSRIEPFAFAFEYRSDPHADILRGSTQRRLTWQRHGEEDRYVVHARHPRDEHLELRLEYDEEHRLIARDVILRDASSWMETDDSEPAVFSRWEFSNFRSYGDGQGNQVWFPSSAMLRYYLGALPDGSLVQSYALQVDVGDIEFNADIPDSRFALQPPEGVPVRDLRDGGNAALGVSY